MATVESSVWSDSSSLSEESGADSSASPDRLHRVATVRRQQGLSLRSVARQIGKDVRSLRQEEGEKSDLRLSDLYQWQRVLGVPLSDLLEDPDTPLSRPVLERARMVRIMKTVKALQERVESTAAKRLVDTLIVQLVELMPELEEVGAWHNVGQRRSLDEFGRTAERVLPDEVFQRFDHR